MSNRVFVGARVYSRAALVWVPTLTDHDPTYPLTLLDPYAAVTGRYLKFNGKQDGVSGLGAGGYGSTGTATLTVFARIVSRPVGPCLIAGFISDNVRPICALWVSRPTFVGSTMADWLGFNTGFDVAGAYNETAVPNIAVPHELLMDGRVYKLQAMVDGPTQTWSVGVDGHRIATGTIGGTFWSPFGGTKYVLGSLNGPFQGVTPVRGCNMEIIQAMFEVDRVLGFEGGRPLIDPNSSPWDALTLHPTATTDSAVYRLNAGSGFPFVDDSGNGWDLDTDDTTRPTWAGAQDPQTPVSGTARWTFENVAGYPTRAEDGPTILAAPVTGPNGPSGDLTAGRLRLAPKARQWLDDGEQLFMYSISTTGLSVSTSQIYNSRSSIQSANAASVTAVGAMPVFGGAATVEEWWGRVWFYDPNGTASGTRLQRWWFTSSGAIQFAVGVMDSVSTTNYVTTVTGAATVNIASSIARATGWHEFVVHIKTESFGNSTVVFMIDGTVVRTETLAALATLDQIGYRINGVSASSGEGYWDSTIVGHKYGASRATLEGLVPAEGSVVLPRLQPSAGIRFFRSVTITEAKAGTHSEEIGTTQYTFRFSENAGLTWTSPVALTTANLAALRPRGIGKEALEVTVWQQSSNNRTCSPATIEIDVLFEPAVTVVKAGEDADHDMIALEV